MFEALFKYPPELFQRGELVLSPMHGPVDLAMLVAAAMLVVAASLWLSRPIRTLSARRRIAIGLLQTLFAVAAVALLARPAMELATLAPGANTVAVLVDTSESMGLAAGDRPGTRLDAATRAVDSLVPVLARSSEIATFVFGRGARRQALDDLHPLEPRTRLLGSIEDVLEGFGGTPLAAAIVVSDGADNASDRSFGRDLSRLRDAGVPVHTIGVGPTLLAGEVRITDVVIPAEAAPETRVVADVVLEHHATGPAVVKVFDGARLVAAGETDLDADTPTQRVRVAFDSGPGGIRELVFSVEPPPGDSVEGNNQLDRLLTVAERRRRVLYVEGEPRWEYKFIRRAVAGDRVLSLSSWLRTTQHKSYRQNVSGPDELPDGFPRTRRELYGYDVVVLGSLNAAYVTDEQHAWLESFVAERGGSLLALAGRESLADGGWDVEPLADALPVRLLRSAGPSYGAVEGAVHLTSVGGRSPIVALMGGEGADPWATLPPLGDYQRLGPPKPAASVLLEMVVAGRPQPLLVVQPYGQGTTAVLATASTWRWRMRTPHEDQRHTLFWRQLLRQLGAQARQPREVRFDVSDDGIEIGLLERDADFTPRTGAMAIATVSGPGVDGDRVPLTPSDVAGELRGRYRPPGAGVYRLDIEVEGDQRTITRFLRFGAQHPEEVRPAQDRALLRRIAEVTGGRYWRLEDIAGIAPSLVFHSAGVRRSERFPLWDMPAAFLLLLSVKGLEWLLRRRWGRI